MSKDLIKIVKDLIERKCESNDLDYKEIIDLSTRTGKKELAKDIAAMANTSGGHLLYGIRDGTHEIVGVDKLSIDKTRIHQIAGAISPAVQIYSDFVEVQGKDVLLLLVHKDNRVHETERGRVPYRNGDITEWADAGKITQMKNQENQIMFESMIQDRRKELTMAPIEFGQDSSFNESVFEIQRADSSELVMVGHPSDFRFLIPEVFRFHFLQELSVESEIRLQIGADLEISYGLKRDTAFDYVGLRLSFVLVDFRGLVVAFDDIINEQLVFLKPLESTDEIILNSMKHYNLTTFFNQDYYLKASQRYYIGLVGELGILNQAWIRDSSFAEPMKLEVGSLEWIDY